MFHNPAVMVLLAILLSTTVVIVVIETGLQRTPMCALAGLGIAMMLWMAYPPAQQLPHVVGFLFWLMISGSIYFFPTTDTARPAAQEDDELLDQFFEEIHP